MVQRQTRQFRQVGETAVRQALDEVVEEVHVVEVRHAVEGVRLQHRQVVVLQAEEGEELEVGEETAG